ncbi:MAG: M14 family zinc carboxypeptidase, partial [Myxococcota bacterium]|nr:M14 family zinc carboxypeptidase [Myxococcota bacterium]
NYGFTWTPGLGKGTYPFSEPETAAMRMMAYRRAYHHSMSMHSGATNLGWVWNHTLERSPDEAFLEDVSSRYQDINSTRDFWITNGADWYLVTGDTNDWSYGARGGQDYTLELTSRKAPAANSIQTYVEEHLEAMIQFLATDGQRGRKGRVVDSLGTGVEASLTLLNSDGEPETGYTLSDATTGAFQRLGFNDSYTLLIEAPGYTTLTLPIELSAELAPEPIEVVLNSIETFEVDIQQPLIFGHREHVPCLLTSPPLPQGYDLAIYRAGNDEPLHILGRNDQDGCTALALSYRAIPLWEDQGTWHLIVLNADQEPVYRFEESVTLLSTSLDPVPELLSGSFEEGVLSVSLEIDTLTHTEVEVLAIAPSGQRTVLTTTPDEQRFQSSNLEALETGTWQLRISLVGQTWASRFLVEDGVITPLPTLAPDGISTSDPSDESDQSDPSDPADSSDATDASDPSVSESDPSTTATPSEPGTTEPSDDASGPVSAPSKESSSGCQSAPSAWLWLVAGLLTRRRKIRV